MRFLTLPVATSLFTSPLLCLAQDTPNAEAQAQALYVYGTVKTYEGRDSLPGASIAVSIPGSPGNLVVLCTNKRGRYEVELGRDRIYRFSYSAPGRVRKSVLIDPTNSPDSIWTGGLAMNIEMTLFKEDPRVDYSPLTEDIGRARYDADRGTIAWDLEYTQRIRDQLDAVRHHLPASGNE